MGFASGCRLAALILVVGLVAGLGTPAWAQLGGPGSSPGGIGHAPKAEPEKPAIPAPDAVPGAKARGPVAPPTRAAGDMPPTDALFDAINRGDIAAARDALNRGADLNGVNVLGMTPMELSVDLGRNDISFLLLSMRGEDSERGSRAVGRDGAGTPVPASQTKQQARAARPVRVERVVNRPAATKRVAIPKLFANDGGAPVPNAGFLGFDARASTN